MKNTQRDEIAGIVPSVLWGDLRRQGKAIPSVG